MKEVMAVESALKVLKLEAIPETIQEVIEIAKEYWKKDIMQKEIQDARTSIIRHMVQEEMKSRRYFEIENVEDACPRCKGTGELFYFHDKEVEVTCHICGGRGLRKVKCPFCDNGRYIKEMVGGGVRINVQCNKCNGEGTRFVKCQNCRGAGQIKKIVKDHNLKNTTKCPVCNYDGFIQPPTPEPVVEQVVEKLVDNMKKEKSLLNTVISEEMHAKLMGGIQH